jgi:hypothetical protein
MPKRLREIGLFRFESWVFCVQFNFAALRFGEWIRCRIRLAEGRTRSHVVWVLTPRMAE